MSREFFSPTCARLLLTGALALSLAACSTTRLAYNHLDRLVSWQGGNYLALDSEQRDRLRDRFQPLWEWHRETQLKLYRDDLLDLAETLEAHRFDRGTLNRSVRMASVHAETALNVGLGTMVGVARDMSDEQIDALEQRVGEDAAERIEAFTEGGEDAWRERSAAEMARSLRHWVGRPNAMQRERIREWAEAREATPEMWVDYQQAWTADLFALLLEQRQNEGFEERLRALLQGRETARSPDLEMAAVADRERWMTLMLDLESTMTDRQRRRLVNRLRGYAEDFGRLASES